ncbi:hypothetical protein PQO03_10950 [Lentisphaera profundi]|uniref:Uncharacterized protein n=1 Tax=Lentisphaera profundi TaxID=1658616 RepID=A0ABY7VPX8_9BACT|nr:hypothetical protein [Lentisphaera profundi]WDE96225.1 hypothetical protein PQO03_10950 [Lentisphaera profundi]
MCLLSTWKTYAGPAIAAVLGFSFLEMLAYNFVPAMLVGLKAWYAGAWFFSLNLKKKQESTKMKKFEALWDRFGDRTAALLSPIFIGIPTYAIIAKKLGANFKRTFINLSTFTLLWCAIFYYGTLVFNLDKHLNIESYIDKVEEIQKNHKKETQGKEK